MKRLIIVLALLIIAGIGAAVYWSPTNRAARFESRMIEGLFSTDAQTRTAALDYWAAPKTPEIPGAHARFFVDLTSRPEIRNRLLHTESDVLLDIAARFEASPLWTAQIPWVHFRVLDARFDPSMSRPEALAILDGLASIHDRVPREFELELLHAVSEHPDGTVIRGAMEMATYFFGADAELIVARGLESPDARTQRSAWLLLAHLDPAGGYGGRWRDLPTPAAEAMLYAATRTDPESGAILLDDVRESPEAAQMSGIITQLELLAQGQHLTIADREFYDRILTVMPVDDPEAFAARISSGTMTAWWLVRLIEVFAGDELYDHAMALARSDVEVRRRMGAYLLGFYRLDDEAIEDIRRSTTDDVTRSYVEAARVMARTAPSPNPDTRLRIRRLIDNAGANGMAIDDAIVAGLACGVSDAAMDAALHPLDPERHMHASPLSIEEARMIVPRFFEDAPLVRMSEGFPRAELLELDALRAWWIVHHHSMVFDGVNRRYRIERETE